MNTTIKLRRRRWQRRWRGQVIYDDALVGRRRYGNFWRRRYGNFWRRRRRRCRIHIPHLNALRNDVLLFVLLIAVHCHLLLLIIIRSSGGIHHRHHRRAVTIAKDSSFFIVGNVYNQRFRAPFDHVTVDLSLIHI